MTVSEQSSHTDRQDARKAGDCYRSVQTANPELRIPTGNPVGNQAHLEGVIEDDFGDDTPVVVCLDGDDAGLGPVDEDDVRRIGLVSVTDHGRSRPELAFSVVPEYHGEGYGKEPVTLVIDYVFDVFHHPAVAEKTFPHNEASRGLLESLAFTQEGRVRKTWYWEGQYRDFVQYGLLREECHAEA